MGWNFRKSKSAGPLRATLTKSGISTSIGTKGLRVSHGADGKNRVSASIPGTGLRYTSTLGSRSGKRSMAKKSKSSGGGCLSWLSTGFVLILVMGVIGMCAPEKDEPETDTTPETTPSLSVSDENTEPETAPETKKETEAETPAETAAPETETTPPETETTPPETETQTAPPETQPPETTPPETTPPETKAPETTPPETTAPETKAPETTYILNTNTMKIHKPTCGSVEDIYPENKSTTTDLEAALASGYTKCGRCKPK